MGCSSVGLHVLYRFAAPQNLTAAPPVAPTPADLVYKQYRRSQMADVAADYFAVNFVSIPPASPPTLKLLPVVEEKPFQIVDDSPEDAPASTPKENDIDPEMQAMRLLGKHHKWQLDQTEPDQYGIVLADSYADSELGEQTTELLAKSYALDPPLWVVRMLLRRISCNHIHHHGFGPIFDAAMKLVGKGGPASPPTPSTRDAVDELLDAAEGVLVSADPGAMARLRDAVNAMAPRTVVGNAAGDAEQSPAVQRAMANFQRVRRDGLTPEQLAELDETGKAIEEAFEGYEAEVTEDARRKAWGLPPVAAGDAERRVVETAKAWKAAQERGDAIDIVEADSALIEAVDALAQSSAPTQSEEPQ
jgi:hypothetical protein